MTQYKSRRQRRSVKSHSPQRWRCELLEARRLLSVSSGFEPLESFGPQMAISPSESGYPTDSDIAAGGTHRQQSVTYDQAFNLHSNPGADLTIYIDVDGHVTEGTTWNYSYDLETIDSPPFDLDNDPTSFNQTELDRLFLAWQQTAEDFAPFDVNVTTSDPGVDALTWDGPGDTTWGVRAVITYDHFADCSCGGHAFFNSFNDPTDTPTFVYNTGPSAIGLTISHEVGHMVGLAHHGTYETGLTYYRGHESTTGGWGPIMGAPFSSNVAQWSRGDYNDSNNWSQDDLDQITDFIPYRDDDFGNSTSSAGTLKIANGAQVNQYGIIEQNSDVDYFSFETAGGIISLHIDPLEIRANLDVFAALYDSNGTLVAHDNPFTKMGASLDSITVGPGTYYLRVEGVGSHDTFNVATDSINSPSSPPWWSNPPEGYSDYGSLGQYVISGTIVAPTSNTFSIVATDAAQIEGDSGSVPLTFTVSRSGNVADPASVDYELVAQTPSEIGQPHRSPVSSSDFVAGTSFAGTLSFAANETSQNLVLQAAGDGEFEQDEYFDLVLSNQSGGWELADSHATGIILADESEVGFSPIGLQQDVFEGPISGSLIRWRHISSVTGAADQWAMDNVSLPGSTLADDFESGINAAAWTSIVNAEVNDNMGGDGDSLFFTGGPERTATSKVLSANPGEIITFDIIFGDSTNGGENVDEGEDVVLEYSLDGGSNWTIFHTVDSQTHKTWSTINVPIPPQVTDRPLSEMSFELLRTGGLTLPSTVNWQAVPGSADVDDLAGGEMPSGTVTFAAGESTATLTITVNPDLALELDESFSIALSSPSGPGTVTMSPFDTAVGTILNDDAGLIGDFNNDGNFDCDDIDMLVAAIAGQSLNLTFDVSGDGQLTIADRDEWLAIAGAANLPSASPYLPGDANLDGVVDVTDLNIWSGNKFTASAAWCNGDFNADGFVDVTDLNIWNGNKFLSSDHAVASVSKKAADDRVLLSNQWIPIKPQPAGGSAQMHADFGATNDRNRIRDAVFGLRDAVFGLRDVLVGSDGADEHQAAAGRDAARSVKITQSALPTRLSPDLR